MIFEPIVLIAAMINVVIMIVVTVGVVMLVAELLTELTTMKLMIHLLSRVNQMKTMKEKKSQKMYQIRDMISLELLLYNLQLNFVLQLTGFSLEIQCASHCLSFPLQNQKNKSFGDTKRHYVKVWTSRASELCQKQKVPISVHLQQRIRET